MTIATRRALTALAAALPLLLATCTSSTGAGETRYTLQTVNGAPLPATPLLYPGIPTWGDVIGGSLRLRADGYATQVLLLRCSPSRPPEATCELPHDGRLVQEGWREGEVASLSGVLVRLTERDGGATIGWACPPSICGFSHSVTFEYR